MFRSDTSAFGAPPWDTGFARRFLTISDEDKKLLSNIPGWATEESEENQSNIIKDQRNLPKRQNQQNTETTSSKSTENTNAGVLSKVSTTNCRTTITEGVIKVSTVSSPNASNVVKLSTDSDIETPITGGLLKEVSVADLESKIKNTFMQSISLYAKKVIKVFSGLHRKRSKSLSDIHQARYDLAMKLSKSETNLTSIGEKEINQNNFRNNEGFGNSDSGETQICKVDESAQTVNKELNNVKGNHVFMKTGSEIVENGELPKTLDHVKVAELLSNINKFFQNSNDTEGNLLKNIGLNSIPCPLKTTEHQATFKPKANVFENDQSSSGKNVKPNLELIMSGDKQEYLPKKCLPDLICNGSLVDFSKDATIEKVTFQSAEKPDDNFVNLSNGSKSKKNTCPENITGNLLPAVPKDVTSYPVIIHVSPIKSSASVLSHKKTGNSTVALLKDFDLKANLPPIEGEETATKTTNAGSFVMDLIGKEQITSVILLPSQKDNLETENGLMSCVETREKSVKTTNSTSISVKDVDTEENLPSVDTRPNKTVNSSTVNCATGKGNVPLITSQEIFTDALDSANHALSSVSYDLPLSNGKIANTQIATSQKSIDKVVEDPVVGVFAQIKGASMETPTLSRGLQNHRNRYVGAVLEPCGTDTVENTFIEPQEAVGTTKVNEINSVTPDCSKPNMHHSNNNPNSIEVVDLTGASSNGHIAENVSKAGASNRLSAKRKHQSSEKPRKKASLVRSQVHIQYSGDELRNMIQLMKMFQSGRV